jgi:hypothetical protein
VSTEIAARCDGVELMSIHWGQGGQQHMKRADKHVWVGMRPWVKPLLVLLL